MDCAHSGERRGDRGLDVTAIRPVATCLSLVVKLLAGCSGESRPTSETTPAPNEGTAKCVVRPR